MNKSFIFHIIVLSIIFNNSCNLKTEEKEAGKSKNAKTEKIKRKKAQIVEIEKGIRANIAKQVEANDGYFRLKLDTGELKLKLVRVHTEYLSNLGPDYNFACVDLADISGDVYDVDFFMKGKPGEMHVTETTVHKLNGRPFYTWK